MYSLHLPILHPMLNKAFKYALTREYLAPFLMVFYSTIPLEHYVLVYVLIKEHMCQLHTTIYST